MCHRKPLFSIARRCFLWLLPLWTITAVATDNYQYRADEYAIISHGRSPDGRWSIAAHGNGEYGYDNFALYLLHEPAHQKPAALRTGDHLDTGPISIVALWSPDSKYVAILYRSDRHVLDLRLYAVAAGKPQSIETPTLTSLIGQPYFRPKAHYELTTRLYRLSWQKSDRLTVEEYAAFDAAEPIFRSGLKDYITVDRRGPQRTFTDFSASATGEITKKGKLRYSQMKPQPQWPTEIVYSPHLLFNPERGLFDTETTLSSMAAQKNSK